MSVSRCVCHQVTFADLQRIVLETECNFEELKSKTGCCTDCGMCEPYVRLMLKTGQTRFEPMTFDTIEKLLLKASSPQNPED
jgi:bacterioferritin-associated ferredoxin